MSNPRVFFDITIGGKGAGRIVMEVMDVAQFCVGPHVFLYVAA